MMGYVLAYKYVLGMYVVCTFTLGGELDFDLFTGGVLGGAAPVLTSVHDSPLTTCPHVLFDVSAASAPVCMSEWGVSE